MPTRDPTIPSGAAGDRRRGLIYPSPFFDVAQSYMPPTIKELLKWCAYFFYTDPLLGSAVYKIAEYPITDFVYNNEDEAVRDKWKDVLENILNIKPFLIEIGLDFFTFGNAFISLNFPFKRLIKCAECKHQEDIQDVKYRFKSWEFHYKCSGCKEETVGTTKDVPVKSPQDINFIRWDPKNIDIEFNPLTGKSRYRYRVPNKIRRAIMQGKPEILNDIPWIFIKAVKENKDIILSTKNLFHFKRPTLAEQDQGWGKPLIIHSLKRLFYLYVLRRAQEAIALERILPKEFVFPQQNSSMDPYSHVNLNQWSSRIQEEIKKFRADPNYVSCVPVPLGFERMGGDGRALMLGPELEIANKEIAGGMGIPLEFLFGGLCISSNTLIPTSNGLIEIGSLVNGKVSQIDLDVPNHLGKSSAIFAHDAGFKKEITLKTRSGYTLSAAETHPVLTLSPSLDLEFKNIGDITEGEYVVQKIGSDIWSGTQYSLGKESDFTKKNHKTFPAEMSPDLGRLLGYIASEGSIDRERICFGNKDKNLIDDYCEIIRTNFDKDPSVYTREYISTLDNGDVFYNVELWSVDIAKFFMNIGAAKSCYEVSIPNCVLRSRKETVVEFLRGYLEGDGTVSIKPNGSGFVSVSSVSKQVLSQIQILLQNMGIESSLYDITGGRKTKTYRIDIKKTLKKFEETIGFISDRKKKKLKSIIPEKPDYVKIPYVKEIVNSLKKEHPIPRWTYRKTDPELKEPFYNAASAAKALGRRDKGFILSAISDGSLKAKVDGKSILISARDLKEYCKSTGVPEHTRGGWPRFYKKYASLNAIKSSDMSAVSKYAPEIAQRIARISEGDLRFDEVVSIEHGDELIPMSDLSVPGPECYIGGGIICHNSWSGSSVSLRTLENHFLMYRRLLMRFLNFVKGHLVVHLGLPDVDLKFTEFKMADDIQRKQLVMQLNAAQKISNKTLLTELGFDFEKEQKTIREEVDKMMELQEIQMKAQSKAQGEAQIMSVKYQMQAQEAQMKAQQQIQEQQAQEQPQQEGQYQEGQEGQQGEGQAEAQPQAQAPAPDQTGAEREMAQQATAQSAQPARGRGEAGGGRMIEFDVDSIAKRWATRLMNMDQAQRNAVLADLQSRMPNMAQVVMQYIGMTPPGGTAGQAQMRPLPEKAPPRRKDSPV